MVALSFYNTQPLQTSSTMHSAKRKIEIHFYFWAKSRSSYLDRFQWDFLRTAEIEREKFRGDYQGLSKNAERTKEEKEDRILCKRKLEILISKNIPCF